jgi:hypothetical protein
MSTNAIVNVRNVDVNSLSFVVGPAKAGRNPSINIKMDGQKNVQFRLPKMSYRLLTREGDNGSTTYTLTAGLKGCDNYGRDRASDSDEIGRLYNFLMDLENKIIQAAVENSPKWFGKKRSEEALRDSFKKIINVSSDKVDGEYVPNGKYPPSFRIKVPVYDGKVSVDVIDNKGNPVYVTPESLPAVFPNNVEANLVVGASIYVIAGGGFGVTWRLTYAQVFPHSRMSAAAVFMTDEEETPAAEEATDSVPVEAPRPVTPVDQPAAAGAAPAAPARRKRVGQ